MSMKIAEIGNVEVARLDGGLRRGVMYQLTNVGFTEDGDFLVVNAATIREVAALIQKDQEEHKGKTP